MLEGKIIGDMIDMAAHTIKEALDRGVDPETAFRKAAYPIMDFLKNEVGDDRHNIDVRDAVVERLRELGVDDDATDEMY